MIKLIYGIFALHYLYTYLLQGRDFELLVKDNGGMIGSVSASFVDIIDIKGEGLRQTSEHYIVDRYTPDSDYIYVSSVEEFKNKSYDDYYQSKDILFQGITYTLVRAGHNFDNCVSDFCGNVNPIWSLKLKNVILTIVDIV